VDDSDDPEQGESDPLAGAVEERDSERAVFSLVLRERLGIFRPSGVD
jgi:hypothetical protein